MRKKIVCLFIACLLIALSISFIGCADNSEKFDYTYEFTLSGGEVLFKNTGSTYEYIIVKDEKDIGYIQVYGQLKNDGVYVPAKFDEKIISIYLLADYDNMSFDITSTNATVTKITGEIDPHEVTQTIPGMEEPLANAPFYTAQKYLVSKNSNENLKFNLLNLKELDANNYNWEMLSIEKEEPDGSKHFLNKGQSILINDKLVEINENFFIKLNLKDTPKTIYQEVENESGTAELNCAVENGKYLISFDGAELVAALAFADPFPILTVSKRYLKLELVDKMSAYMVIYSA